MLPTGYGFNRPFDCSGVPATFEISLKPLTVRGDATSVGILFKREASYKPMHTAFSEKLVTGSICSIKTDFEECVAAFESGLIPIKEFQSLISSKIKLKDSAKLGFDELMNHKEEYVKILFSP